ncbi:hypothetical protein [Bradyrhizobium sp. BRP23]|uniref:hypothetical protein n=1 Tax=Bradyrhizobium sp. BRP23 TaxID=2793820 RepID=UPI001CD78430|nr:hypothetical protein [Bradyrhizobium sp. BRP23]MCA1380198.1 hypothetical protein [Bradyrhizobium sp. BRP05]MCA1419643.1 hypothetical protein [Bradyrhizobium sp. BRP23]
MEIAPIEVSSLRLNPHNDRHGALRDESAAIHWLLENRTMHMRALAADLARTKRLYESPLVRQDRDTYTVFDGNRRTCCIKLLANPDLAPSAKWKEFFLELSSEEVLGAFTTIDCEIENDLSVIDEKLFRRHTGSQEGVGQSQWDPEGKSNFLQRTGKESIGLGETIEKALKSENLLPPEAALPWSNIERLLSSEPIRRRAGISFAGGSLAYLGNRTDNLATLQRIATDLSNRRVVLGDLWNNEKKGQYLDRLKSEGMSIDNVPARQGQRTETTLHGPPPAPQRRRASKEKNLISRADENPFVKFPQLERAEKIWRELQFNLEFDEHDNAIAVLMRVLLEIAINHYARAQGIVFGQNDPFAKRVSAVADSMLNRGFVDVKGRSIIRKFEGDKPIVSAHSMHQYVHNANFHPMPVNLENSDKEERRDSLM